MVGWLDESAMAKKSSDELFQAFLADVLNSVPAESKADVEKVLRDERVTAKMKEGVLARSDYSRQMDELTQAREALNAEVTEARTRISGWEDWYAKASQEVANVQTKLSTYEQRYGKLDGTQPPQKPSLTEEDFHKRLTEELQRHDAMAIAFANDLTRVQIDHLKEFKETLDTDKLINDATKRGVTLRQAYQEFVAPMIKEREEKRFEEALKKAKEEGAAEYASNHRLPFVPGPSEPHVLDSMTRSDTPRTEGDRIAAAVKGWREATSQSR